MRRKKVDLEAVWRRQGQEVASFVVQKRGKNVTILS